MGGSWGRWTKHEIKAVMTLRVNFRAEDVNNSRLRVAVCNDDDPSMVWDYDKLNGHVYLRADRQRCIVVGPIGHVGADQTLEATQWMKISNKCRTNTWGRF